MTKTKTKTMVDRTKTKNKTMVWHDQNQDNTMLWHDENQDQDHGWQNQDQDHGWQNQDQDHDSTWPRPRQYHALTWPKPRPTPWFTKPRSRTTSAFVGLLCESVQDYIMDVDLETLNWQTCWLEHQASTPCSAPTSATKTTTTTIPQSRDHRLKMPQHLWTTTPTCGRFSALFSKLTVQLHGMCIATKSLGLPIKTGANFFCQWVIGPWNSLSAGAEHFESLVALFKKSRFIGYLLCDWFVG